MDDSGGVSGRSIQSEAEEIFGLLSNERRMAILMTLWEAHEPFTEDNAVPFTELRRRVGARDSGNFNYHLGKLEGHFIESTEKGYKLRNAGHKIIQAVIAGSGIKEKSFGPTEIDLECYLCGAPTAVMYEDEWIYWTCTECEGLVGRSNKYPEGTLVVFSLNPVAVRDRTPEQMFAMASLQAVQEVRSMVEGVCSECSGTVDRSVDVCKDHDPDGVCDNCGLRHPVIIRLRCTVCKSSKVTTPQMLVAYHPTVVSFYNDHGVSLHWNVSGISSFTRIWNLVEKHETELISDDPLRIRVTVPYENDKMSLTLDEELRVMEVNR